MAYDEIVTLPANAINTPHWVRATTGDGRQYYSLTGVLVPHLKGNGADWRRLTLKAKIAIPAIPSGKKLQLQHWAPAVSLAAIGNENVAVNAGYAVDGAYLENPGTAATAVSLAVQAAVRDVDGWVFRMTYDITLTGSYV